MKNDFIQKNGIATHIIARDLLTLSEGSKMKTISEYEEQINCSRWTIQTAIQYLLGNHCFRMETMGSKGSLVYDLDKKLLYNYAGLNPLFGLLPMPSTRIHDSLFTGIVDAVNRAGMPIDFAHMVPASKRLEMLLKGQCNFILTSKLAYEIKKNELSNLRVGLELKGSQYCSLYKLFTLRDDVTSITDGMRVGIYDASIEQRYITNLLCAEKDVQKKQGNYSNLFIMLATGEIDALVQSEDVLASKWPGIKSFDLPEMGIEDQVVLPVLLVNQDDYGIGKLLEQSIDVEMISYVQISVLSGRRTSNYF
jgi:hypothetical protein